MRSMLLLLLGACASVTRVENAPEAWGDADPVPSQMVDFTVTSNVPHDMKLYLVRYETQFRIGYVTGGGRNQTVRLRKSDLDSSGCIVLRLVPMAAGTGGNQWTSSRVCMRPDEQRLELQINSPLSTTALVPWPKRRPAR
jgi:hypothetical protein